MGNIIDSLQQFWQFTGFANCTWQHLLMICIGLIFITLGIVKHWEPLLLVPIGFGMIIGNIPLFFDPATGVGLKIGIYEEGSVLNILYHGVKNGWYPPAHLPGHRGDDGLLGPDLAAAPDPDRRRRPDGYLRRLPALARARLRAQ